MEDAAIGHQLLAQGQEVGEIAIVGDGHATLVEISEHRLDVADETTAGSGIAGVANGRLAREAGSQVVASKGVADIAHVTFSMETLAIEADDAAGLLPAML